jgi:hypothetical protein
MCVEAVQNIGESGQTQVKKRCPRADADFVMPNPSYN